MGGGVLGKLGALWKELVDLLGGHRGGHWEHWEGVTEMMVKGLLGALGGGYWGCWKH